MSIQNCPIPPTNPVGRPSFAQDEGDYLVCLSALVADSCHTLAEHPHSFSSEGIRGTAYIAEYIQGRIAAYTAQSRRPLE